MFLFNTNHNLLLNLTKQRLFHNIYHVLNIHVMRGLVRRSLDWYLPTLVFVCLTNSHNKNKLIWMSPWEIKISYILLTKSFIN